MKHVLWMVMVIICAGTWAEAQGQTIADMARRERAKRRAAQTQTPQKSLPITNSTLKVNAPAPEEVKPPAEPVTPTAPTATATATAAAPVSPPAPISPAAITPPTAPPPAEAAAPPSKEPPARDEKWWRERFDKARAEVRRSENQVAVSELEYNAANREFLTTSYDPDGRGPAAIAASKKKMDDAKKRLDEARSKLVQLEEELRRAGAPAGWAR